MRLSLTTIALFLGLVNGIRSDGNGTTQEVSLAAVANACNDFSTALYKAVSNSSGNLVMSPFSVETVMTLAWLGATGETAKELAMGLHLPDSRDSVEMGFMFIMAGLESTDTITLDIANKMYIQEGYQLKAPFRQSAVTSFRSDAEEVNFVNATEAARTAINKWVEKNTHNKIKNLVAPGTLSADTKMVAINAIYFRGGWLKPFNESLTTIKPFFTSPNTSVNVSMMHQVEYFLHGEIPDLKAQVLKMFYRGTTDDDSYKDATKSMLILLPESIDGLSALEANITSLNISQISSYLSKKHMIVSIPKFKIESTLKLAESLQKLGMSKIFRPGAELSGISDEELYMSNIIQKAYIDVSEKGTEAAAATFFELVNFIASPPTVMNVNRPFLFLIMDEPSNAVLFMGRVSHPDPSQ